MDRAAAAWAGRPAGEAAKRVGRRSRSVDGGLAPHRSAAVQVLMARRTAGLRQRQHRRGRAVHDDRVTVLGVSRRDSALALLHAASQASAAMVLVRRLVVAHRHDYVAARRGHHRLDVLAATTLPPCRRADEHPVSRLEAVARDHRPLLRRGRDDVGVQRPAVDGPVSDHGPAHGADRASAGRGRRPRRRTGSERGPLRGGSRASAVGLCGAIAGAMRLRAVCRLRRQGARVDVVRRGAALPCGQWPRWDARRSDDRAIRSRRTIRQQ